MQQACELILNLALRAPVELTEEWSLISPCGVQIYMETKLPHVKKKKKSYSQQVSDIIAEKLEFLDT